MGIFDIFGTGPSQQAAAAQTAGLNAGYNVASGDINQAIGALNQNYGTAGQQLQTNYTSALAPATAAELWRSKRKPVLRSSATSSV